MRSAMSDSGRPWAIHHASSRWRVGKPSARSAASRRGPRATRRVMCSATACCAPRAAAMRVARRVNQPCALPHSICGTGKGSPGTADARKRRSNSCRGSGNAPAVPRQRQLKASRRSASASGESHCAWPCSEVISRPSPATSLSGVPASSDWRMHTRWACKRSSTNSSSRVNGLAPMWRYRISEPSALPLRARSTHVVQSVTPAGRSNTL